MARSAAQSPAQSPSHEPSQEPSAARTAARTLVSQRRLTGERAAFFAHDTDFIDVTFADGESPLKHASGIDLTECWFQWKYPLWHCRDVSVRNSTWLEMGRAGVWYTDRIAVEDSTIEAPKNFRRCSDVTLRNVDFTHADETLWDCTDVELSNVVARGDYFGMNCARIDASNFRLVGNYPFDGAKDVTIRDSRLISKDAFWNTRNVTVEHSFICGEYLGWNSENLTLVDCTIESLQGLCYARNLTLKHCRLVNTTLAFEYSTVDADVDSTIDSVINPSGGTIRSFGIGELTMDPVRIDPSATRIETKEERA